MPACLRSADLTVIVTVAPVPASLIMAQSLSRFSPAPRNTTPASPLHAAAPRRDTLPDQHVLPRPSSRQGLPVTGGQHTARMLELCCGAGGLSYLAYHSTDELKIEPQYAVDFDSSACQSYTANHPEAFVFCIGLVEWIFMAKQWHTLSSKLEQQAAHQALQAKGPQAWRDAQGKGEGPVKWDPTFMPTFHSGVSSKYQRGGKGGKSKATYKLPKGWPKSGEYQVRGGQGQGRGLGVCRRYGNL
jgi:hypothetical protein